MSSVGRHSITPRAPRSLFRQKLKPRDRVSPFRRVSGVPLTRPAFATRWHPSRRPIQGLRTGRGPSRSRSAVAMACWMSSASIGPPTCQWRKMQTKNRSCAANEVTRHRDRWTSPRTWRPAQMQCSLRAAVATRKAVRLVTIEVAGHSEYNELILREGICGSASFGACHAGRCRITLGEESVQLRYDCGPLPDGRPHSLHRAATHVANGEDPLDPGLQR